MTSQNDLHARMSRITGREVKSIPVPEMLASLGAKAISSVGWKVSMGDAELQMMKEGNAIREGRRERRYDLLGITPTPLDVGLRALAELQPEQLPIAGRGLAQAEAVLGGHRRLDAHAGVAVHAVPRAFRRRDTAVRGREGASRARRDVIERGETLTLALPMRGTRPGARRGGGASGA